MSFDSLAESAARKLNKNEKFSEKINVSGYGFYDNVTGKLISQISGNVEDLIKDYEDDMFNQIDNKDCLEMLKAILIGDVVLKKFTLVETK